MKLTQEWGTYSQPGLIHLYGSFQTNGSSAPTIMRDGNCRMIYGTGSLGSVVRTSKGLYTITLDTGFPIPAIPILMWVGNHVLSSPTAVSVNAYFVDGSWNTATRSFQVLMVSGSPVPTLVTGQAVSSNAATLPSAGYVQQVQATAGTTVGVKTIILSGTPATGQVAVTYSAGGVPTLTFATADAVTACEYVQITQAVVDADANVRVDFEIVGAIESAGVDPA